MTVKQKSELLQKMTKSSGKKAKVERPDIVELSGLYEKMTAVEIGKHYGVPATTVRNWISYYRKQLKEQQ